MSQIQRNGKGGANIVHLAGWLVVDDVSTLPLLKRQGIAVRGHLWMQKPGSGKTASDESYPVLFTSKPAEIVLHWAKVRPSKPIKMTVSGRLFRKGSLLTVWVKYLEVLEVQTAPLDETLPTVARRS